MGVVIEKDEAWSPHPVSYLLLFASCAASITLLPHFSRTRTSSSSSSPFDLGPSAPFLRFQRSFLLLFSLSSALQGLQSVFGEYEFTEYGVGRETVALYLAVGAAAALVVGSFSGVISDIIGPRKSCLLFCILHLLMGVMKSVSRHPNMWVTSISVALASSLFSFCFETWMVAEHEKQGHGQELLYDTFWLMTLYESASFVGSQGLANSLLTNLHKGFLSPSALAALLATVSILFIRKEWNGYQYTANTASYRKSFSAHVLNDKRVWMLAWAQASVHFSMSIFWILWAPTIVADGREVRLSLVYPCFLGSRMLGSTVFPWFFGGASSLHSEDSLTVSFIVAGLALLTLAYDYQETGFSVILFCVFNACVGFILPSLARLRTLYVPNELRGGVMSFSLGPSNAAILLVLIQGGYHHNLENATVMVLSALGLLAAAGCIHVLRWWRKHPRQSWHTL